MAERDGERIRRQIYKQSQKDFEMIQKTGKYPSWFTKDMIDKIKNEGPKEPMAFDPINYEDLDQYLDV
jgi:hypothetical protein